MAMIVVYCIDQPRRGVITNNQCLLRWSINGKFVPFLPFFFSHLLQADASVDLTKDTSLQVDISDALSEQERVKFTVHTKVSKMDITVD